LWCFETAQCNAQTNDFEYLLGDNWDKLFPKKAIVVEEFWKCVGTSGIGRKGEKAALNISSQC
jgi:hypothetical protein